MKPSKKQVEQTKFDAMKRKIHETVCPNNSRYPNWHRVQDNPPFIPHDHAYVDVSFDVPIVFAFRLCPCGKKIRADVLWCAECWLREMCPF